MATNISQPAVPGPTPLGYPKLAEHLGEHPDFASFRRFGALSSRNLLYYQAELLELEEELEKLERRDSDLSKNGLDEDRASTWYWLGGRGCEEQSNKDQLKLVLRLRGLLQQYSS
jgi:hypothetical protein